MIPSLNEFEDFAEEEEGLDFEVSEETSRTYKLNSEKAAIFGFTDGTPAIEQAIYKILNTERYEYPIYSWGYGVETGDLIGEDMLYAAVELEDRIRDALLWDDRIEEITDYETQIEKNKLFVTFTAVTVEGPLGIAKEVSL